MADKHHKYINNRDIQTLADKFVLDRTEESFNALMRQCERGLRYYIGEYTKEKYDIDSITSRTMECLYFKIDKYNQNRGKFTTWMFKIAHNIVLNYFDRGETKRKINRTSQDISDMSLNNCNVASIESVTYDEINELDNLLFDGKTWILYNDEKVLNDIYDTSIECIGHLPDNFKVAMTERYINKKRINDIAKDNNKTKVEIKNYLHFGSKRLSKDVSAKNPYLYRRFMETT